MGRKRRYYREDRKYPVYQEEIDEWDDEDEDADRDPMEMDRFIKGTSWGILVFLAVGALLSIAQSLYAPAYRESGQERQGYRIVSVSQGKLHTVELATGKSYSFPDQDLVKQAINGSLKRGDVIYR